MCEIWPLELEVLKILFTLRVMSRGQLQKYFYGERTDGAFRARLSVLRQNGILDIDQSILKPSLQICSLGKYGLGALVGWPSDEKLVPDLDVQNFPSFKKWSPGSAWHQVQTSEVFLEIREKYSTLGFDELPFRWLGWQWPKLRFREYGKQIWHELRPDAVIEPKAGNGRRIFLELDHIRESIDQGRKRNTIVSKFKAYNSFLFDQPMEGLHRKPTWYEQYFKDDRPAEVVFILTKSDTRAANPEFMHRRMKNILAVAKKETPNVKVECLYLEKRDFLAAKILEILGLKSTDRAREAKPMSVELPYETRALLAKKASELMTAVKGVIATNPSKPENQTIRKAAWQFREVFMKVVVEGNPIGAE